MECITRQDCLNSSYINPDFHLNLQEISKNNVIKERHTDMKLIPFFLQPIVCSALRVVTLSAHPLPKAFSELLEIFSARELQVK